MFFSLFYTASYTPAFLASVLLQRDLEDKHNLSRQPTTAQWDNYPNLEDSVRGNPREPSTAELVAADSAPLVPTPKNEMSSEARIFAASLASLAVLGGSFALNHYTNTSETESAPQQAAPVEAPGVPVQNKEDSDSNEVSSEEAMAALKKVNIDLANGIVTILAAPKSGAEADNDGSISNKLAVVGSDRKSGTKDDLTDAPESTLYIDTASDTIGFLSAQEFTTDVVTGKPLQESEFSYASGTFEVKDKSLLDSLKGKKPTVDDFRRIFSEHPDALIFQRLEVESRFSHIYVVEKNVLGELTITDTDYGSVLPITEVTEGDADFKKTLLATSEAADATVLELQASWTPDK